MAVIHILDKHTAELIAAGEVVERPSSVVKELTENAIDAGATAVSIRITKGGISLIEIQDDGCGIEPDYINTAFIRHATSKIEKETDLEHIATLGFRGEALASIASVAKVQLLTKTSENDTAFLYCIEGGEEQYMIEGARPQGTTITVRDLFFNTPARMKFLKKDTSEANYVQDVVMQLALSHPEVAFKFTRDNKEQFYTPGDGKLLSAIYAVLSRDFGKDLVEVNAQEDGVCVAGYITPPKAARASRSMQFFYINGRLVKNRTLMAAVEQAYRGTVMQGRFPGCVLNISMPCDKVDVNVHPAKTEVRFAKDSEIFDAVYKAVKGALFKPQNLQKAMDMRFSAKAEEKPTPEKVKAALGVLSACAVSNRTEEPSLPCEQIDFLASTPVVAYQTQKTSDKNPVDVKPQQLFDAEGLLSKEQVEFGKDFLTTSDQSSIEEPIREALPKQVHNVLQQHEEEPDTFKEKNDDTASSFNTKTLQLVGEVFKTYIIAQYEDEMCFIDKHAAHERILYEKLVAGYGKVASQMLLTPVTVQLSAQEKNALLSVEAILLEAGIEAEDFGGSSVLIRAVPADVVEQDVENLVIEIADKLIVNNRDTVSDKTDWILHSIACRGAIKAGDKTPFEQLLKLAQDILNETVPPFCPHGRPVILKLTQKELEKQFGRLG
ncbi:MAG: DNA mismatch repair endonuclease MutL [Oscillospiraceae bacterium]|nr:DNA mismatch repair endonuclease MutL [Oscillospiraceae bacterium]